MPNNNITTGILPQKDSGGSDNAPDAPKLFLEDQGPKVILLSIKQFCAKHTAITNAMIRRAIFYTKRTGIVQSGALLRIGGTWVVDEQKMIEYMRGYARKWAAKKPDPDGERKRPAWATK